MPMDLRAFLDDPIREKNKCTKEPGCDFRIFDPTIQIPKPVLSEVEGSKSGPADQNGQGFR